MSGVVMWQSRVWWALVVVAAVWAPCVAEGGDVQHWDVAAKFLSLKPGRADVAVFEVDDAARVEIPLSALSEANRTAIAELAKGTPASSEMKNQGDGESSAAGDGPASAMVSHAIDLLRLGNPQLAKQELQKASKADPSRGEADFVMGIVYALGARSYEKAVDHFAEAVRREPDNAAAVANLALCELHTKHYSSAVVHFRRALELKPDGQAIADNMALAIQAVGTGRVRITEKVLAELNDLYRTALVDRNLSRLDPAASRALVFHGLDGRVVEPQSPTAVLDAVYVPAATAPDKPVPEKPAARSSPSDEASAGPVP